MSKLNNVKYGLLMAAALLVASCNKSKDKNEKKNFQTEFEHQKEINGYNALAGEDTKCFAEYDQIDSIKWNNSLGKEILAEFEKSAAVVMRDVNSQLKSVLKSYNIVWNDTVSVNVGDAYMMMLDEQSNLYRNWYACQMSAIAEYVEHAGLSEKKCSSILEQWYQIVVNAKKRVLRVAKLIEARYEKSHNVSSEIYMWRVYVEPEEINFAKISHADSVKIDSLWTIIKAKNELQKRKDSLSNAAWEAARKVCY
ncbi:MAG: hypothetical protein K6B71_01695 [Alphaproteobacteria bacterium]|nr:hypothetical protein [Alphaproteobacteria bacterium]